MKRFIQGQYRSQSTLFPESLDAYIDEGNAVRVVDAYVDELDLFSLGFERVNPKATGRPGYHPSVLLKLYIYGYLNSKTNKAATKGNGFIVLYSVKNIILNNFFIGIRMFPEHQ